MIKNLKKVISTLAAVAILATSASAFAVSFPDVDANASYAGAVDALTTLGVVNGDDNGKFNPENTVTRAEFAKMVVEALGTHTMDKLPITIKVFLQLMKFKQYQICYWICKLFFKN